MPDWESNSNLDFMRAVAVLAVVVFHLVLLFQITLPGPLIFHSFGQWGVMMFFVHTSLVLALSLARQARRAPEQRLFWPFMIQRVFRIFPLSVVVVVAVVVAHLPVGDISHGRFIAANLDAVGFWSDIFLVQNITHRESAVVPLWSLPYEMQMYFVLPALFLLASRVRTVLPLLVMWAIGLIPIVRPWYFARHGVPDAIGYVSYFLPGVIAFRLISGRRLQLPPILWPIALAVIAAIFLQEPTALRAAFCCLMLGIAIPQFREIENPVVCRVSHEIAKYSYGIYLAHCICMWWAFQGVGDLSAWVRWILFVVSLGLISCALYHMLEAPMIRLGRRLAGSLSRKQRRKAVVSLGQLD